MEYVNSFVQYLIKAIKNCKLYQKVSEATDDFISKAYNSLIESQKSQGAIVLVIDEDKITNESDILYEDPRNITSIPLFLYRNGIRTITFLEGIKQKEIRRFVEIMGSREYTSETGLVEDLWEERFEHLLYHAVEKSRDITDYYEDIEDKADIDAENISIFSVEPSREKTMDHYRKKSLISYQPKIRVKRSNIPYLLLESYRDILNFEKNPSKRKELLLLLRDSVTKFLESGKVSLLFESKKLMENLLQEERAREYREIIYDIYDIISSEKAIQLYIHALSSSKSTRIKEYALNLLAFTGKDSINTLINEIEITTDSEIRDAILSLLEGIFEANKEELAKRLEKSNGKIQRFLLDIVGKLKDPYFVPLLKKLLRKEKSEKIKKTLFSILPREEILKYLKDEEPSIRITALRNLKEIWSNEEFEIIKNKIVSEEFWDLPDEEKRNLLNLLATLKLDETFDVFNYVLKKWHFFNRNVYRTKEYAIKALSKMESERAKEIISRYRNSRHLKKVVKEVLNKK